MGSKISISGQEWHEIAAIVMAIFGAILTGISSSNFKHLKKTCHQKTVKSGNLWIMVIGTILLCISIMYAFCRFTGGVCGAGSLGTELQVYYTLLAGVLCVTVFALSISMLVKLGKLDKSRDKADNLQYTNCGGSNVKGGIIILTIISGLGILLLTAGPVIGFLKGDDVQDEKKKKTNDFRGFFGQPDSDDDSDDLDLN